MNCIGKQPWIFKFNLWPIEAKGKCGTTSISNPNLPLETSPYGYKDLADSNKKYFQRL
jgi:hypothetical protein